MARSLFQSSMDNGYTACRRSQWGQCRRIWCWEHLIHFASHPKATTAAGTPSTVAIRACLSLRPLYRNVEDIERSKLRSLFLAVLCEFVRVAEVFAIPLAWKPGSRSSCLPIIGILQTVWRKDTSASFR